MTLIREKRTLTSTVFEIEQQTRHDVVAFTPVFLIRESAVDREVAERVRLPLNQ